MSKDRGGDVTATNSADRKNNGGGGGGGNDPGVNQLLDAASLFAYWGGQNPQQAAAAAAAAGAGGNALFGNPFAGAGLGAMLGGGGAGGGNPGAAAGQGAGAAVPSQVVGSLSGGGPPPNYWMAQLAAQDYFSRLQASGFGQMPFSQNDLAGFPPGLAASMGMLPMNGNAASGGGGGSSRGGNESSKGNSRSKKDRKSNNSNNNSSNNNSAANQYQQSAAMYNHAANLQLAMQAAAAAAMAQGLPTGNASSGGGGSGGFHQGSGSGGGSTSKKQSSSSNKSSSGGGGSGSSSHYNQMSHHHQQQQGGKGGGGGGSSGGDRGGSNYKESGRSSASSTSSGAYGNSTAAQLSMNAMLAANPQFASLSSLQSQLNAAADMSAALLGVATAGQGGKSSGGGAGGMLNAALEGSDSSSLLGVRLPPDTEIIKYTSSMVGPKVPGSAQQQNANGRGGGGNSAQSNEGRSASSSGDRGHNDSSADSMAAKRSRLDPDYSHQQNDRVEVIKLPSNGVYNLSTKSNAKDGGGNNKDNDWLNLSTKTNHSATGSFGGSGGGESEGDAPLNLSLKSGGDTKLGSASPGNSLQSLSSITAALGSSGGGGSGKSNSERSARRRAAAAGQQQQPTQIVQQQQAQRNQELNDSYFSNLLKKATAPISSTDEDFDFESPFMQYKEGRPRNLGRGVSKPKKNTVASLLAQSRAVGIKPMLNPSDMDYEKLKQMLAEASQSVDMMSGTDSESVAAESGMSESESESAEAPANVQELRAPLDRGWKRETVIKGLTKNGQIRGDVYYMAPNSQQKIKNFTQLEPVLSKQMELTRDNFSFSARPLVGMFLQAPPFPPDADYIRMTDEDVSKRLDELKMFTRHSQLDVEQRIEIAKQQQAMREAKKMAKDEMARNKEKAKLAKEQEKNERLEAQRKERELKTQQAMEARRKKQEELEKLKMEEMQRKQQEKELKKQRALLQKEQELNKQKEMLYAIELERERRRQHTNYQKQLDLRRRFDEREKKKHQMALDKLIARERRLAHRNRNSELLAELRKPHEDMSILQDEKEVQDFPELQRVPNMKLTGQAFADLLMVFEFLHNFGETLGFDMESLPTLDSLHQALVAENALEAEEELLSVMTHLLVCAIEDPGVPNPNRHTTLLGQSLRQADLTNANISEVLRIYLYAIATGEVRQMTRIGFERERERRVADHHQADVMDYTSSKNSQYYELLHENTTWKLSEQLRDKPFVSLSPPLKAQILAHLCNDLLMNKAVLKQIETSLESANQMRKDRYLMDAKIRKCRSTHQRKVRMSQFLAEAERFEKAKQEQLALQKKEQEEREAKENSEAAVNGEEAGEVADKSSEEVTNLNGSADKEGTDKSTDLDGGEKDTAVNESTTNGEAMGDAEIPAPVQATIPVIEPPKVEKEATPEPKAAAVTTKTPSTNANKTVTEIEEELSDMEEMPTSLLGDTEDEDERLSVEELAKKLEKLEKQAAHNQEVFDTSIKQLRGQHVGQDRFWRRYWNLPKAGGIYVEGLESAQGEIMRYHEVLEEECLKHKAETGEQEDEEHSKEEVTASPDSDNDEEDEDEDVNTEDNEGDVEMKEDNVDSSVQNNTPSTESSDSNSTADEEPQKDGFEAEVKKPEDVTSLPVNGTEDSQEGDDVKMVEPPTVDKPVKAEPEQMDIEDSIPSMFVQRKANGTSAVGDEVTPVAEDTAVPVKSESTEEQATAIKTESVIKSETSDQLSVTDVKKEEPMEVTAEATTATRPDIVIVEDSEDNDIKKEEELEAEEEKWFSIVNRDVPLDSTECPASFATQVLYNNISCETIVQMQGHRWDIVNNLQYYNTATLDLPNASEFVVPNETILTPSGLNEGLMSKVLSSEDMESTLAEIKQETIDAGDRKAKSLSMAKQMGEELVQHGFTIPPFLSITLPNISNYLQCDNSVPLTMSEEEEKMLEVIKVHGWPKKNLLNFVPKRLRHGWWKINDKDLAEALADVLLMRGVREKSLRTNLLNALTEEVDFSQTCPLGPLDDSETIADVEFVEPSSVAAFNPRIIERVEMALLEQIESLEDKISSASMQIKGWSAPSRETSEAAIAAAAAAAALANGGMDCDGGDQVCVAPVAPTVDHSIGMMRERILDLEAAIERRYLKPPLGNNVGEVSLAMLAQNQDGTTGTGSASGTSTPAASVYPTITNNSASCFASTASMPGACGMATNNSSQNVGSSQQSNHSDQTEDGSEPENISKGLVSWRDAVSRSVTTAQLSMALYVLESCVAWDKSIMKAPVLQILKQMKLAKKTKRKKSGSQSDRTFQNCQFCHSGENEDKLLLCDSCDKGYHTYCFKPRMDKIPEGDWYCFECVNKATGERKCIVCGGLRPAPVGKVLLCELCPRAYHHDCMIPPLIKVPRGKWYCHGCVSKAPPPKKRVRKSKDQAPQTPATPNQSATPMQCNTPQTPKSHNQNSMSHDEVPLSPAYSVASASFDDNASNMHSMNQSIYTSPNHHGSTGVGSSNVNNNTSGFLSQQQQTLQLQQSSVTSNGLSALNSSSSVGGAVVGVTPAGSRSNSNTRASSPTTSCDMHMDSSMDEGMNSSSSVVAMNEVRDNNKKDKQNTKKLIKEMAPCKTMLQEMEVHEEAWPFLLPVNTKQFPTYKKIIKAPMDLSTIQKRVHDLNYKSRDEFINDVRQIFDNCEVFNEDDSPVGKAGHNMRKFFEMRWSELTDKGS